MNWEALGAIGELAGALGVIVTLAYLARQMRVNTVALQNETTRDSTQMIIDSYSTVIADEAIAAIYLKGLESFEALSDVEKIRFHYICCQRLHAASVNLSFQSAGRSKAPLSDGLESWIERMLVRKGFREWYDSRGYAVVNQAVTEVVETIRDRVAPRSD